MPTIPLGSSELREAYHLAIAAHNQEISQIIQRNNFFMIFQGVLLGALLQASGAGKIVPIVSFLICLAGLLISILQIMMAAGTKFWLERWVHTVEEIETLLFPNAEIPPYGSALKVFSKSREMITNVVNERMRGSPLRFLITRNFSPSRIPIYAALIFSLTWLILMLCTIKGIFDIPNWIVGFP